MRPTVRQAALRLAGLLLLLWERRILVLKYVIRLTFSARPASEILLCKQDLTGAGLGMSRPGDIAPSFLTSGMNSETAGASVDGTGRREKTAVSIARWNGRGPGLNFLMKTSRGVASGKPCPAPESYIGKDFRRVIHVYYNDIPVRHRLFSGGCGIPQPRTSEHLFH